MYLENDVKLDFDDVLIRPKRSDLESRSQVTLERQFTFRHAEFGWTGVPIVASNVNTIGTFKTAKVLSKYNMLTLLRKFYDVNDFEKANLSRRELENVVVTAGSFKEDIDRIVRVLDYYPEITKIDLDVANGYTKMFSNHVRKIREMFPDHIIIAGAVATAEMTEQLILDGADVVRVGIGPGSVCVTRKMTGVGYPQLSAIIECCDAAHGLKGHIMSDGGCRVAGDVAKAFCGGADFVILGGMFAGTDETGTDYYGMASETAMNENYGGIPDYRAAEGKHVKLPDRGPLENVIKEIMGGLRSTGTYIGASKIKEFPKRTTFVRVNRQLNTVFNQYEI